LHAWLEAELLAVLATLPPARSVPEEDNRAAWERWRAGLTIKATLPHELPPLRMLLVMDNLAGHLTTTVVVWLFEHGIMLLYTPLSGSWLNMTESIQRIIAARALAGQTPVTTAELIEWLEATARAWNADPTPVEWGGKRQLRRQRAYQRRHPLGGSGACHPQTSPTPTPVHATMATFRSSDPLAVSRGATASAVWRPVVGE
jgi:hypothetical protein